MMKQTIDGDGNIQIGTVNGNCLLTTPGLPAPDGRNPNMVYCPFGCGQVTCWCAPECKRCGGPVHRYFTEQALKSDREVRRVRGVVYFVAGPGLIGSILFLPSGWSSHLLAMAVAVLLIGQAQLLAVD